MSQIKKIAQGLLKEAGITIDGSAHYDPQIHDERLYERVLRDGSIGLGESYMDGWWDVENLHLFFVKLLQAKLDEKIVNNKKILLTMLAAKFINFQSKAKAFEVGEKHYDLGMLCLSSCWIRT